MPVTVSAIGIVAPAAEVTATAEVAVAAEVPATPEMAAATAGLLDRAFRRRNLCRNGRSCVGCRSLARQQQQAHGCNRRQSECSHHIGTYSSSWSDINPT
jgi:hypothetical protein